LPQQQQQKPSAIQGSTGFVVGDQDGIHRSEPDAASPTDAGPGEQDLLQLGRTTKRYRSNQLQANGFQVIPFEALVTPLVTYSASNRHD
jgi:hypothetical protein